MSQIYYNKSLLIRGLLPVMLIAVCALYVLVDGAEDVRQTFLFGVLDSPWLFYPIMVVIFISFAQYSWLSLRKVVRKKPAIRWGSAGMTLANGSRVAWAAVAAIEPALLPHSNWLLVHIDQPLAFIDMQTGERQSEAKRCFKRHHTPIAINCTELTASAPDLCLLLRQQWQLFMYQQTCSKP